MITQENIPYTADEIKAMVKTIEELRKKYKEALERARELQKNSNGMILKKWLWSVFPELKESEDEKIKREIVAYINELADLKNEKIPTKWLDWLEKQGDRKTSPKFKVRDWIVDDKTPNDVFYVIEVLEDKIIKL